jgi:hypothetical protein
MVNRIDGYWIDAESLGGAFASTLTLPTAGQPAFPPGTTVWATISLSQVEFFPNDPRLQYGAQAFVKSWTVYKPDGTPSAPFNGLETQNAVGIENCAGITFQLGVINATAIAQINVFTF